MHQCLIMHSVSRAASVGRVNPRHSIGLQQKSKHYRRACSVLARRSHNRGTSQVNIRRKSTARDDGDLYRWTRARFVQNEAQEMAARYVRFNLDELTKVAAAAAGSKSCTQVEKLLDGMHNKALLLKMDDGQEVVAKIPYPAAGQPHFTTASEVATMDFMRRYRDTPVPKVLAWCNRPQQSPVGAEYVIMEKAAGVPLKSVWSKLRLGQQFEVVRQIADLQRQWSAVQYAGYGSIYYQSDMSDQDCLPLCQGDQDVPANTEFALGPRVGRDWNDDGRQSVSFDQGPWDTLEGYMRAIGLREMTCVKELARLPPPQVTLCGPGTYISTREKKTRALQYYLKTAEHLTPMEADIRKPSAWHGDLHPENIYVDPEEPTRLTSMIDWQSTEVAPLFFQTRQPYLLDHKGPKASGLEEPRLPNDYDNLMTAERDAADWLLHHQSLEVAYHWWIQAKAPEIWKCFEFQNTPAYDLLLLPRSLLVDGEAIYAARVVDQLRSDTGVLKNSGLVVPEDVAQEIEQDAEDALRGMQAMSDIKATIGELFPERGCVRAEQYDEVKDALRQCKEQIVEMYAKNDEERAIWEETWPFDD